MKKSVISIICSCFISAASLTAAYAQETGDSPALNKVFYVKSVQAGKNLFGFWDQTGYPKKFKKGDILELYEHENQTDHQYVVEKTSDGWYNIRSNNGGYIDVAAGGNVNGTKICIWEKNGSDNQKFRFKYLGDGRWKIYAKNGKVICTPRKYDNGTQVHIWDDHDGAWMEWYFIGEDGKGYVPVAQKPDFFINNKKFKYSESSLVGSTTGTAVVKSVKGDVIELEVKAISNMEGKKENLKFILKINFRNGQYTSGSPDYLCTGEVNPNDKIIVFSCDQSGFSLTVMP